MLFFFLFMAKFFPTSGSNQNSKIAMKKILSFAVGSLLMASAAFAQTAKISPKPLRVVGDSVVFSAQLFVPADKVMKKEGNYVIMPELGDRKFPPIRIPSSQLGEAHKNGISVKVRSAVKFEEDMIGNDLEIEHEFEYGNNMSSNKEFADMDDLAECCITTGRLYAMNTQYNLHKYTYVPGEKNPAKVVVQFNFPQDISKLKDEVYDAEIDEIGNYLKKHKDASVTIRGFASPEGTFERNTQLSRERAQVAKKWLLDKLKQNGYGKNLKAENIKIETTVEDWNGFQEKLQNSNLSYADQARIEKVISNGSNPAAIEDSVIAIVGGMKQAEQYLMPLRRTTVVVESNNAKRNAYSAAEIDSIMTKYNANKISEAALKDIFNSNEYLYASQQTNAEAGKLSLLVAYYQQEGGDYKIYSDLGAMAMINTSQVDIIGGDDAIIGTGFSRDEWDLDGEVDFDEHKLKVKQKVKQEDVKDGLDMKTKSKINFKDGEVLLLEAYEMNSSDPVILNNLGAYYLSEGEYAKAKDYLTASLKAEESAGVNYNLGLYYGLMGDYKKSLTHFNKAEDVQCMEYNRAITKLMLDDAAGARKDLETLLKEDPNNMLAHFAMGIVGARLNDMNLMTEHLPVAMEITQNKNLSDATSENLEFRNYMNDDRFEAAIDDDMKDRSEIEESKLEHEEDRIDNMNDRDD